MKLFKYETCCVNAKGKDIQVMVEQNRDITYRTFFKYVSLDDVLEVFEGYVKDSRKGLTLKNDWAVSYSKSLYQGRPCYYINHSMIEYIFTKEGRDEG